MERFVRTARAALIETPGESKKNFVEGQKNTPFNGAANAFAEAHRANHPNHG
jgi:hypothetical protein